VLRAEEVSFDGAKNDEKKPSEGQAHVHVTQDRVSPEYLPVQETLHENLPDALHERQSEKTSLQAQLV
jgi:hypothetical protein